MGQDQPSRGAWWPLVVGLLAVTILLGLIIKSSLSHSVPLAVGQTMPTVSLAAPTETLNILFLKQTLEAASMQTTVADLKAPSPGPGTLKPTIEAGPPEMPFIPDSTPAGAGMIVLAPSPPTGYFITTAWVENSGGKKIVVYAGVLRDDLNAQDDSTLVYLGGSQGIVYTVISGTIEGYKTPSQDGPISIIDAQGERLVLKAENGKLFYFDVPSRQFVDSLTAPNPATVTPPTTKLESASTSTPPSAYP
jgi:hypothetical protein